ncbi:hypothetical protein V6N11_079600 [Hibiscus sabdariffa]|uniref:SMP domain-containing protein n=1 Tax=Hibiscus sabdariffa TaxID=183260 RepID=A0ABR2RVU9_9ROSI
MAFAAPQNSSRVHRIPQSKYIDAVRWLSPVSGLDRFAAVAYYDTDTNSPSIEIICVDPNPQGSSPTLTPQFSWTPPSRISSLKTAHSTQQPIVAAATFSGSIHILASDLINGGAVESEATVSELGFHSGPVSAVDLREGGTECVSVGEDGRVNLVSFVRDSSKLSYRRIFDANGLVGYTAVKWASPSEFATGGYGFGLQWWDQRRPGGPIHSLRQKHRLNLVSEDTPTSATRNSQMLRLVAAEIETEIQTGTVRKAGGNFKEKLRERGGLDVVFEVAMECHSVMEVVGQYCQDVSNSGFEEGGDITIGEVLEATALTSGEKPVEWSDAAAIHTAKVRATGYNTILPDSIAEEAQSATTCNARLTKDEDKIYRKIIGK